MASTITSNRPVIQAERTYKDLDLNFTPHPVKKDVSRYFNEKAIINSVKNLVSTNFYERPFRPDIGSGVREILFELVDTVSAASLERQITEVIKNFEPRVTVDRVTAAPSQDENGYDVTLEFFIVNLPNPISINFFLERIR
jgi:phage baseplate assembly protein W